MTQAAERALDAFTKRMDKQYGAGVFRRNPEIVTYDVIPTGSIILDVALGVGGYVVGRLHELWGNEHAGKTTLATLGMVQAQRKFLDKQVCMIDMEHRYDLPWAASLGLDLSRLFLVQPENAEEVADMLKDVLRSGLFSFVVLDSVGAMIPEIEMDKDADQSAMGKKAGVVTRMVQIAGVEADKSKTTVLFLNQVRANFEMQGATTTPGGHALKHATTARLKIKRMGSTDTTYKAKIDGEDRIVGYQAAVKVERLSVAPAYRTATFPIFVVPTERYGPVGIDSADEAFTIGIKTGLIQQGGAWYTITATGEKLNGREAAVDALRAQPETVMDIRTKALAMVAHEVKSEDEPPVKEEPKKAGFRKGLAEAQGDNE